MTDVLQFIADAAKPKVVPVDVDGKAVFVRGMGPVHRASFNQMLAQALVENSNVPDHVIVAWGICNEDGSRPAGTPEEILASLEWLDGVILNRIAAKILELSGYTKMAVENAAKN